MLHLPFPKLNPRQTLQSNFPSLLCSPDRCCFFFFLLYLNLTCFWTVATAADSKWKARAFPWGPWGRQWLSRGAAPIQQEAHQNLPEEEGGAAHDTKMGSLGTCRSTSHPQGKGKENTLLNVSNKLHSWHEVALGKEQPWKKQPILAAHSGESKRWGLSWHSRFQFGCILNFAIVQGFSC